MREDQPVSFRRTSTQKLSSFRAGTRLTRFTPQSCSAARLYRSCESGMRTSAVQPSESMAVRTSQTGSKP